MLLCISTAMWSELPSYPAWLHVCSVTTSCPILCDPMDCSPPGIQARTMEWVVISFSRESSRPRDPTYVSYVSCILAGGFLPISATWEAPYLLLAAAAAATATKSLQSCLTLCDPIDSSPLGSSVPRILQARILEWVAISFSNAWKWKVKVKSLSRAWLLATPWTRAYQAPPSMGFSRQEYWSGVPLPSLLPHYQKN